MEQITNSKSIHPSLQKNFFFVKAIKYLKQEEKDYSRSIEILKTLKEIKREFDNKKKPRKPKNLNEKKRRNIEKKIKFETQRFKNHKWMVLLDKKKLLIIKKNVK